MITKIKAEYFSQHLKKLLLLSHLPRSLCVSHIKVNFILLNCSLLCPLRCIYITDYSFLRPSIMKKFSNQINERFRPYDFVALNKGIFFPYFISTYNVTYSWERQSVSWNVFFYNLWFFFRFSSKMGVFISVWFCMRPKCYQC